MRQILLVLTRPQTGLKPPYTTIHILLSSLYSNVRLCSQALVLRGRLKCEFAFRIDNASVSVSEGLKILGVTLDKKLAFKEHITLQLGKAYRMTAVLRRSRRLNPIRNCESKRLSKPFILLLFEYYVLMRNS